MPGGAAVTSADSPAPRKKPAKKPAKGSAKKPAKGAGGPIDELVVRTSDAEGADGRFPIVGIGASAGGLEALRLFLESVPPRSGMAFIVVQHLDPNHKAMLPDLLQRTTPMKVVQITDHTQVRRDHVYVIPPNKDLSILHGVLHLLDPSATHGLRLPIDFFFRSLADDEQQHSIGVVLSGMGTDGTLGLKGIKGKAGVVFVQDPASAAFDGMPRSAIEAGLADVVAPAEALPGKIAEYLHHAPLLAPAGPLDDGPAHSAFEKIVILLRAQTGHDFSLYKKTTVARRIERRMGIHQIERILTYVQFLRENPQELDLLFKELLIGVTNFFRDPEAWAELEADVVPALLERHTPGQAIRIWVAGCSTGEEAYSLAMVFREALDARESARSRSLQIFATDLDRDAIAKARTGVFPENIVADVSPERLERFFTRTEDGGYRIAQSIRETVIFAPQDVLMDPPFSKIDLVTCRNLLIYLTRELQARLLPLFHHALNPGGFLFLGSAETVGEPSRLFAAPRGKARIYQRLDSGSRSELVHFPAVVPLARPAVSPSARTATSPSNLQSLAEQMLLRRYAPAAVLVNDKGDIVFVSGRTGRYLEPASGKANWNLFAMARDGLRSELGSEFRKALAAVGTIQRRTARVSRDGGCAQMVDVTVQVLARPHALAGLVMVVFTDVVTPSEDKSPARSGGQTAGSAPGSPGAAIEHELDEARIEQRYLREEMQAAREEAESASEELQSANEELQSTNEELTTSKEELQSLNEELQTLNQELLAKVDDVSRVNSDLRNLLENSEIATVFLDASLCVRLFTAGSHRVFRLIPSDVGRPITDLASQLEYPGLMGDVREVLRTLTPHEESVAASDGRWFDVRISPYRTVDDRIDGATITFTDITAARALEDRLRQTQAGLEERIAEQETRLDEVEEVLRAEHRPQRTEQAGGGADGPATPQDPAP